MLESDLEKLIKSELMELLLECEEMRVGDVIIANESIQCMGRPNYHVVYQIIEQDGDMFA